MTTAPSTVDGAVERVPVLEMKGISKRFDATQALADVSLSLYPGETHALLGENGAGKSTLIKIMTGIYSPDAGEIVLRGEETTFKTSADAQRAGIAAIYQEPAIFPDLNVAENIFISHQDRGALVRWHRMYDQAEAILGRIDVRLDVRMLASGLTVASQQAVEIAKALSLDVRALIMDEPTAALSAHEVSELFTQIRRLTDSGVAVLFISHRLDEVFEIADRVTVLRDGRRISSRPRSEVTQGGAIREMVGRDMSEFFARTAHAPGEPVLEVEGLGREGAFSGVSFDLREGEVLGFAGLVGAGRTDVGLALFGIAPPDAGTVQLRGKRVAAHSPRQALRAGIAYLSEDRRQLGLSLPQSLTANITLATLRNYVTRLRLLDSSAEREVADGFRQEALDPDAVARHARRAALGRQPAEDHARQVAERQAGRAHPGRADARHRRRRQGRGPPDRRRARPFRDGDHPHLVRPARGARDERSGPRHARGPADGVVRPCRGHRGAGHHGCDGGRMTAVLRLRPERLRELSLLVVIALAVLLFSFLIDDYLTGSFFNRISTSVAITAVLAAGQTIVILTRNIDLSVGSVVGVTAYLTGEYLQSHPDTAPALAVAIAVSIGAGLGLSTACSSRTGASRRSS